MAKRIRPASQYQRVNEPVRLLAVHAKAGLKRDFKASLGHLESMVKSGPLGFQLRMGAFNQVHHGLDFGHWREVLKVPFNRIVTLRHASGQLGSRKINGAFRRAGRRVRFGKDIGDRFNFDMLDAGTITRVRAAQDQLIQQLTYEARNTVDSIVRTGVRQGLTPDEIVGDIRQMIGLTDTQASAVMNYRRMLEELDPTALARQLRNTAYDASLQDAIDNADFLSEAAIDRMTQDYLDNYLDYRANAIAETESTRAANAGLRDAYQQAVDRGALPGAAVRRYWQISLKETTCDICLSIPDLNPDGVEVDQPFDSEDGPIDDAPVHPHCGCSAEYVTDLDQVPDDQEEAA